MRIHAHIRSNIPSRRSGGDFGSSMSKNDFRGAASRTHCKIMTKTTRIEGKNRLIPSSHEAHEE